MSTGPFYSTPPQVWIDSPLMTLIVPTVACRPCMATAMSAGAQGVVTHSHSHTHTHTHSHTLTHTHTHTHTHTLTHTHTHTHSHTHLSAGRENMLLTNRNDITIQYMQVINALLNSNSL